MDEQAPDVDFETSSWHDDTVYAIRFDVGDASRGDWRSELVLDIDHIVEWVCGVDGGAEFRVAPATLTFHDVTDLRIVVDFDTGDQVSLNELSIDEIEREPAEDRKVRLDGPYYRWRIALNVPREGEISFGASGFTQDLRADPVLLEEQRLGRDRL